MLFFPQKPLIKTQIVSYEFHMEVSEVKTETNGCKIGCCKTLIYS